MKVRTHTLSRHWRCQRCGYHYGPDKLLVGPGPIRFPVCADRERCDRHIALREKDRRAVRGG